MAQNNNDIRLGRFMSMVLRHHSEQIGIALDSIKRDGIKRMKRMYVHLSKDVETAVNVGRRHGKPVVLVIDTKAMHEDGYLFRITANGVWQSEDIPWRYVVEIIE